MPFTRLVMVEVNINENGDISALKYFMNKPMSEVEGASS